MSLSLQLLIIQVFKFFQISYGFGFRQKWAQFSFQVVQLRLGLKCQFNKKPMERLPSLFKEKEPEASSAEIYS